MDKWTQMAFKYFEKREYVLAMNMYSSAIKEDDENEEAKLGIMLCDMAMNNDRENAHNLFDYYFIVKHNDKENAFKILCDLVDSNVQNAHHLDKIINSAIAEKYDSINGILFKDFLHIFENSEDKKKTLENVLFSSKIIISNQKELISFISLATKIGFTDITNNYLNNLTITFDYNKKVIEVIEELEINSAKETTKGNL